MTFGTALPLDCDWTEAGQRNARIEGRPFGVPNISNPATGVELAERLGFAAAILCGYALLSWLSGKMMLEPEVLGDNCYYLGFLYAPFPPHWDFAFIREFRRDWLTFSPS